MKQETQDIISAWSSKVTMVGGGTGLVGFLGSSHFIGLVGLIVAVGGFLVNWYYKHKEDRRREAKWQKEMKKLSTAPAPLSSGDEP